jgi:hypothetical protein
MRHDIGKVIFGRAKSGRTWVSKTPRAPAVTLDRDGEQFDESANSIRRRSQKMLNGRFNAVERFLVRSVGRPWSKVYAEICERADPRSFAGAQIRYAVEWAVHMKCWVDGKQVIVHPKSGILSCKLTAGTPESTHRPVP